LDGVETFPALTSAVVSALILAMLAAIFFLPARVDLDVDGDTLVVRPRGLDVLWTLEVPDPDATAARLNEVLVAR
jgi:hypothetical protein